MTRSPDPKLADQWRDRLLRFERSGLSVADFCLDEDYSPASFYQWRRRLADDAGEATASFVPAKVLPPLASGVSLRQSAELAIRIELPGGAVVCLDADAPGELLRRSIVAVLDATNHEVHA
jgi:hypothetical protein